MSTSEKQLKHYSLEERMVEPFRSIHWLSISPWTITSSLFTFLLLLYTWWNKRLLIFHIWSKLLGYFIHFTHSNWTIRTGPWGEPKLEAWIVAPSPTVWWISFSVVVLSWLWVSRWSNRFIPLRAAIRFLLFLVSISLVMFALYPLGFRHSIEEWSKTYFTVTYAMIPISGFIWMIGVLWFPLLWRAKLGVTFLLLFYELICTPVLLFTLVLLLEQSSLLLLPVFALAVVPLLRLGWFVAFYSTALSYGKLPS